MKKILIVLIALLAIGISISAVSAEGFSFSFGSETNSDGGDISIDNDKLTIQGIEFKIPEGFKENETGRLVANDTDSFGGCKVTATELYNNDSNIIVKVFFDNDGTIDNVTGNNPLKIANKDGFISENDEGRSIFDYGVDGKVVEINAPNQEIIQSVLKA